MPGVILGGLRGGGGGLANWAWLQMCSVSCAVGMALFGLL